MRGFYSECALLRPYFYNPLKDYVDALITVDLAHKDCPLWHPHLPPVDVIREVVSQFLVDLGKFSESAL